MKIQEFNEGLNPGFKALSIYYPEENVWQSDFCEPHEWNSEEEMRMDMLSHYLGEDASIIALIRSWDCSDEHELISKFIQYQNRRDEHDIYDHYNDR